MMFFGHNHAMHVHRMILHIYCNITYFVLTPINEFNEIDHRVLTMQVRFQVVHTITDVEVWHKAQMALSLVWHGLYGVGELIACKGGMVHGETPNGNLNFHKRLCCKVRYHLSY